MLKEAALVSDQCRFHVQPVRHQVRCGQFGAHKWTSGADVCNVMVSA